MLKLRLRFLKHRILEQSAKGKIQVNLHLHKQFVTAAARFHIGGATVVRCAVAIVDDAIREVEIDDARLQANCNARWSSRGDLYALVAEMTITDCD